MTCQWQSEDQTHFCLTPSPADFTHCLYLPLVIQGCHEPHSPGNPMCL